MTAAPNLRKQLIDQDWPTSGLENSATAEFPKSPRLLASPGRPSKPTLAPSTKRMADLDQGAANASARFRLCVTSAITQQRRESGHSRHFAFVHREPDRLDLGQSSVTKTE
jgi:hypothetical protein